jgi:hypothetical protein
MSTSRGNDPKGARLVYIAAFAPEKGESVETLIQNPPGVPVPPIMPPQDGFRYQRHDDNFIDALADKGIGYVRDFLMADLRRYKHPRSTMRQDR